MNFILSKKLLYCYIVILLIWSCFWWVNISFAQNSILEIPDNCNCSNPAPGACQKYCEGDYTLNDFVQSFVNIAQWIWGIAGSLALLAFIYGGIMFLISGGSSERVAKAKQIIIGAALGLIIVFVSYIIIGFIFTAFKIPGAENWATSNWFSQ